MPDDDLIRLSLAFGIPPGRIDEEMDNEDALAVMDYLRRVPQTAEIVNRQLARVIAAMAAIFGRNVSEEDMLLRERTKQEEFDETKDALGWLAYVERVKNGSNTTTS